MRGASKDYKFGQKNNWRRWQWNEILGRTKGTEKTQPTIYMPGLKDHDRPVAARKGLPGENLIGVEGRDPKVVKLVRANGGYCVEAEVHQVLRNWPVDVPVAALALDFCGGLQSCNWTRELAYFLARRPFRRTVIALNFQRGRDHDSKSFREVADDGAMVAAHLLPSELRDRAAAFKKNRAHQFLIWMGIFLCNRHEDGCLDRFCVNFLRMNPSYKSYRSGKLTFDSVVINAPLDPGDVFERSVEQCMDDVYPRDINVVRLIAATLAIRTRRRGAA